MAKKLFQESGYCLGVVPYKLQVQSFQRIAGLVIIRVPEKGRVGDHDRGNPCVPKCGISPWLSCPERVISLLVL